MKKIFIGIAGFTALILVVLAAFYVFQLFQRTAFESVLPQHPAAFLRIRDIEQKLDYLGNTDLWKKLKNIQVRQALKKMGAAEKDLVVYDRILDNAANPTNQAVLKRLFGLDSAVAVYLTEDTALNAQAAQEILSRMIVVTRLRPEFRSLESLSTILLKGQADVEHKKYRYKNHDIHLIGKRGTDFLIGYTRIKDLLILGVGDQAARRCLETLGGLQKSLKEDLWFRKVRDGYLPKSDSSGYIDLGSLAERIRKAVVGIMAQRAPEDSQKMQAMLGQNLKQMFGFQQVGFSGKFLPFMQFKLDVYYDAADFDPRLRTIYDCQPKDNESLAFIPQEVLSYQWGACYDFGYYWKQMKQDMARPDKMSDQKMSPAEVLASLEKGMNIDLEKNVIPLLGDEAGNAVLDIYTGGMFPVPGMLFFVKVNDTDKAARIMETFKGQAGLVRWEKEDYQGRQIAYFNLPLVQNLTPGYVFIKDYLVVSSQHLLLRQALDMLNAPDRALAQQRYFQDDVTHLAGKSNSVMYVNVADLSGKILSVVEWANQWLTVQLEQQEAVQQGQEKYLEDIRRQTTEKETRLSEFSSELSSLKQVIEENQFFESQVQYIRDRIAAREAALKAQETEPEDEDLQQLRQRLNDLLEREKELVPMMEKIQQIEENIRTVQAEVVAGREKEKELQAMIQEYEGSRTMPPQVREVLIRDLIEPFLKALSALEMIANKVMFKEGVVQLYMYLKMN